MGKMFPKTPLDGAGRKETRELLDEKKIQLV